MAKKRRLQPRRPGQPPPPSDAPRAREGAGGRGVAVALGALFLTFLVGSALGAVASFMMPGVAVFGADRARAALLADGAGSLADAQALAAGEPVLAPVGALAAALLAFEHHGGTAERVQAEAFLKGATLSVRTQPEALYARALLHARAEQDDPALDGELAKKNDDDAPFVLLARAQRQIALGKRAEGEALLQRAALAGDAPAHAQVVYARALAARGEIADARALLERLWRAQPDHAGSRALAIAIAVWDDAREETPDEQASKQKKLRERGGKKRVQKPGEVHDDDEPSAVWRTSAEELALGRLDAFGAHDAALLAVLLETIAAARNDVELVAQLRARVLAVAARAPRIAAAQIDLALLEGDVAGAEEVWNAAAGEEGAPSEPALLASRSRLRALQLLPEAEIARRAQTGRAITPGALMLPFGNATLDVGAAGLPVRYAFGPEVPDLAIAAAVSAPAGDLDRRLKTVDALFASERALARGDLASATQLLTTARDLAPGDPDVLLLDARVRVRQGDAASAKVALETALAQSPDDPRVLVGVARLAVDADAVPLARRALTKLKGLGVTAPGGVALEAVLAARADDERAKDLLTRAKQLAPGHVDTLRASILFARNADDGAAVREAADRLATLDDGRTGDAVVRAWVAEALARRGDVLRAEGIIEELLDKKLAVADATYVKAGLVRASDPAAAAELMKKAAALAPNTFLARPEK